ncbi:MAG TPA: molybdopterin-binding protein, partial [Rubrivivax sp.]|nr:molybdopterin-binding protein [Rubrivivax sp.]
RDRGRSGADAWRARYEKHERMLAQTTAWAANHGLAPLPIPADRSPLVSCLRAGQVDVSALVSGLKRRGFQISNGYGALKGETFRIGHMGDHTEQGLAALLAAADADLILTSGGVSVGEEDHLRPAVQAEGELTLWQIAMKPGKPLAFGRVRRGAGDGARADAGAIFMGLPGNPVSSFVTFLVAVAPVLRAIQGMPNPAPQSYALRADFDWPRPDRRREFLRVRLNDRGALDLFPNQSSGVLTSTVWADGLVDLPAGQAVAAGDVVRFLPLHELVGR